MNDHFLIPRLAPGEASALFERHVGDLRRGAGPTDLVDLNVRGTPNRTGGAVPRPWVVEGWRKQVIEQIDMPEDMTISERSTFGLRVGRAVEEVISPILADAAHDGTWWYLSLAVFPDLVYRRWPAVGTGADLLLSRDRWLWEGEGQELPQELLAALGRFRASGRQDRATAGRGRDGPDAGTSRRCTQHSSDSSVCSGDWGVRFGIPEWTNGIRASTHASCQLVHGVHNT